MYKALHLSTDEEIVILAPQWRKRIGELRNLDRQNLLVCQGCRQPVRVKAGHRRRAHFAHKHLKGCTYGMVSPEVLEGRGRLYEWLVGQFGEGVTVEKRLEGVDLPRAVDAWIEQEGTCLAYWIIAARMKLEAREKVRAALERPGISVTWVLTADLLQPDLTHDGCILLSPTERDFLKESIYDEIGKEMERPGWSESNFGPGGTLHFLDAEAGRLITYRALRCVHRPNVFRGRQEEHDLAEVRASHTSGEFIHPGEEEKLQKSRLEEMEREQAEEEAKARLAEWLEQSRKPISRIDSLTRPDGWGVMPQAEETQAYACVFCGAITDDWWMTFIVDGERRCKCRGCKKKGLV